MDWLHFVGKAYYSQESFEREAKRYGVSRRASPQALVSMSWGDRIWLAQGDMKTTRRKTPSQGSLVFGSFYLERIAGLSKPALQAIHREVSLQPIPSSRVGEIVKRGCGAYILGPSYKASVPLHKIIQVLREFSISGDDLGIVLLQGDFIPLLPNIHLPDVSFRWGFRRFDSSLFLENYQSFGPSLQGEFRREEEAQGQRAEGVLQEVGNYSQAVLYSTLVEQAIQLEKLTKYSVYLLY